MASKDEIEKQAIGGAVRLAIPGIMGLAFLILLFVFWPQVSALFGAIEDLDTSLKNSGENKEDLAIVQLDMRDVKRTIEEQTETIDKLNKSVIEIRDRENAFEREINRTMTEALQKLSVVDQHAERLSTLEAWRGIIDDELIILNDFQGDTVDELARRDVVISDNTQKHTDQVLRANTRKEQHARRDERLDEVEAVDRDQNKRIRNLEDFNLQKGYDIRATR